MQSTLLKLKQLFELLLNLLALWFIILCIGRGIGLALSKLLIQIIHYFYRVPVTPLLSKQVENFMCSIITYGIPLIYLYKKQEIKRFLQLPPHLVRHLIPISMATLLLMIVLSLWMAIQAKYFAHILGKPVQSEVYYTSIGHFVCCGILSSSCLVPITEELLFRVILPQRLYALTEKKWLAIIISTILFSLAHGCLANSLYYFTVGCFLSYLYHKTDHMLYPILAHAIHNLLISFASYYFSLNGRTVNDYAHAFFSM